MPTPYPGRFLPPQPATVEIYCIKAFHKHNVLSTIQDVRGHAVGIVTSFTIDLLLNKYLHIALIWQTRGTSLKLIHEPDSKPTAI
jgi:hypothetical protein